MSVKMKVEETAIYGNAGIKSLGDFYIAGFQASVEGFILMGCYAALVSTTGKCM